MATNPPKGNQSVGKTIRIIETLASSRNPLRLSQIAAEVEMPASTVLRMLNTLIEAGYAYQEDDEMKRYGLTMRFVQIGQMITEHFNIRDVAHPYLAQMARESNESCCLAIEDHDTTRYLDVVEGSQSLVTIRQRVGGVAPMHCTGSGKLILSQYSEEKLKDFIEKKGLPALTSHTITTYEEMKFELEKVVQNGYAIDDEECEIGMRCIAAPIYDTSNKLVAVMSLSGPISRMTKLRMEKELIPLVCEYANRIIHKLPIR